MSAYSTRKKKSLHLLDFDRLYITPACHGQRKRLAT